MRDNALQETNKHQSIHKYHKLQTLKEKECDITHCFSTVDTLHGDCQAMKQQDIFHFTH